MRRVSLALVAGALGLTLAVVPTNFAPEQAAYAYVCVSSIDPRCNPGNIPILIEAGVIAAPKPGAAVVASAVPPATASTGLVLDLSIVGAATLAIAGFLGLTMDVGDGFKGAPALHQNGLGKLDIATDPDFTTVAPGLLPFGGPTSGCTGWLGAAVPPPDDNLGQRCEGSGPFILTRAGGPRGEITVNQNTIVLVALEEWWQTSTNSITLRLMCGSEVSTAPNSSTTINSRFTAGSQRILRLTDTQTGAPTTCPSGAVVDRLVVNGPFTSSGTTQMTTTVWNRAGMAATDVISGVATASVDCKGPGGVQTVTASQPYTVTAGQTITTPEVVCPPGTLAVGAGLTVDQGGTTTEIIPRDDNDVLPKISELVELLPHCFGPDAVPCPMVLQRLDGGTWQDCGPNGSWCPTWAATPEPQLQQLFRCQVGGVVVDIRYCSAFRAPTIGVLPNVGPDGELLHPSAPAPNSGSLFSPTPPGGGPSTGAPPGWLELIDLDRDDGAQCWPTGWGMLNPVSWVLMPVGCALEAAFVPSASMQTATAARLDTVMSDTAFSTFADSIPAITAAFSGGGTGCVGPPLRIAAFGIDETFYPFNACQEPLAGAAATVKTMLTVTIVLLSIMAVIRYVSASIGFAPFGTSAGTSRQASGGSDD